MTAPPAAPCCGRSRATAASTAPTGPFPVRPSRSPALKAGAAAERLPRCEAGLPQQRLQAGALPAGLEVFDHGRPVVGRFDHRHGAPRCAAGPVVPIGIGRHGCAHAPVPALRTARPRSYRPWSGSRWRRRTASPAPRPVRRRRWRRGVGRVPMRLASGESALEAQRRRADQRAIFLRGGASLRAPGRIKIHRNGATDLPRSSSAGRAKTCLPACPASPFCTEQKRPCDRGRPKRAAGTAASPSARRLGGKSARLGRSKSPKVGEWSCASQPDAPACLLTAC